MPWMCSISLLTFWCNLMETILLKRFYGNYTLENLYGRFDGNYTLENLYGQFDGNYTFDQIDVNYTLENLYGQFYGKKGLDWSNLWSLRMSVEQRDTYGNDYGARARVVLSEAQIQLAARNTNLWNNPLVRQVRTNEVSERMSPSERRELLLQVRTNEVSEHMLQKRPKGASSDRSSERSERQRERQATEGSDER